MSAASMNPSALPQAQFAMGCFWGVERKFWNEPGVVATRVGYAGGHADAPSYQAVCTGATGHAEVVRLAYDPAVVGYERLLQVFWENHDPTQGMRQGNDVGTQYRSAIHCFTQEQYRAAIASRDAYQRRLDEAGYGRITTEIVHPAPAFHEAEEYHQRYLEKNPQGYCGIGGTGVSCPVALPA